jgi:hypothetical protein
MRRRLQKSLKHTAHPSSLAQPILFFFSNSLRVFSLMK